MPDLSIEHPLHRRDGLPDQVREQLIDYGYGSWEEHPRFYGQAEFLLQIHGFFREAAGLVVQQAASLLESVPPSLDDDPRVIHLRGIGAQLIDVAHHHHQLEDHHFFPVCAEIWSPLADGLALLENDHVVLAGILEELGGAIRPSASEPGVVLERLHDVTARLERALLRHLADEEEIVIPMLLDGRVG